MAPSLAGRPYPAPRALRRLHAPDGAPVAVAVAAPDAVPDAAPYDLVESRCSSIRLEEVRRGDRFGAGCS
ncbi:MAG TPA: hypothetical protein VGA13_01405 [Acidimicrobiales bacterium]